MQNNTAYLKQRVKQNNPNNKKEICRKATEIGSSYNLSCKTYNNEIPLQCVRSSFRMHKQQFNDILTWTNNIGTKKKPVSVTNDRIICRAKINGNEHLLFA